MADVNKARTIPREIGTTGLRYTNQNIVDDELAKEIRWPYSIETYEKMKSDALIAGALTMIKQYIRKVEWDVSPYGGLEATDEDKRLSDIVKDALFMRTERSWDQVVADILTFIEYGFSIHEPTYKLYKGNFIWKDFPQRSAKTITGFEFNDRGYLKSIKQTSYNSLLMSSGVKSEKVIPYNRLLHFRTDSERNNPLGRSILKNAYRAWYMKTKLEYFEAIGIEREMNGLPVMKIPMEYFAADPVEDPDRAAILQEFIKIGTNARNNEQACVIIPSDVDESGKEMFSFDLVASRGTRSIDTSNVIERYDYRISQSMLSDFILMGSSSSGSFALSDNKISSFIQALEAYLEIIAEQFNRKAIPRLYELNGWDASKTCQLVHKPIGAAHLNDLGSFLNNVKNYIVPDRTLENAIRARADLPPHDSATEYIDVPTSTHQALSQRIAMEASAAKENAPVDADETSSQDDEDELVESLEKALTGVYSGEA